MKLRCLACGFTDVRRWQNHSIVKRTMVHALSCLRCGIKEESINGRNWRSFTEKDSDPVKRAGQSTGADPSWVPITFSQAQYYANPFTGTFASPSPGKSLTLQSLNDSLNLWFSLWPGTKTKEPPKLEVCAPEVGEIIAHRMWRYCGGFVQSASVNEVWQPGEVMIGELGHIGEFGAKTGIYSWKTKALVLKEAALHHSHYSMLMTKSERREIVIGTVRLWGTVIEHEHGYRSENARVVSFDDIMAWPGFPVEEALTSLRRKYGV